MEETTLRELGPDDLAAAMELTRMAGWNQTVDDWRGFAAVSPSGCFAAVRDDRVAGTAVALPVTDGIGWISMVLVHERYRRLGIATMLVRVCLDHLAACATIMLDATADGAPVYRQLGFETVGTITRYRRQATYPEVPDAPSVALDTISIDQAIRLDFEITGMDRSAVLRTVMAHDGVVAVQAEPDRRAGGYGVLRPGHRALQLGPLVASTPEVGKALAVAMTTQCADELIADIPDGRFAPAVIEGLGFQPERVFERMAHGAVPDTLRGVVATAGPDWS